VSGAESEAERAAIGREGAESEMQVTGEPYGTGAGVAEMGFNVERQNDRSRPVLLALTCFDI